MYQAVSLPDGSPFRIADTPCASLAECVKRAQQTFGEGKYTIERIRRVKA
jgi:hypothetical protein